MDTLNVKRKEPIYLGIFLIVAGVGLKRLIELTLVSDMRIELPLYLALIYAVQLLAIVSGVILLIKQPAIKFPRKTELILPVFSILLTFSFLEIGARLWLNYLATPASLT